MFEEIFIDRKLAALILRSDYKDDGISFFSPEDFSQQLGYMSRPKGYVIPPHLHNPVQREVYFTKEVLFIKSGQVRADFYDDDKVYQFSRILNQGDIILLAFGGHGFEIMEEAEIIEVKQGPYVGELDNTRFEPVSPGQIQYKD